MELISFSSSGTLWANLAKRELGYYQQKDEYDQYDHYKDTLVEISLSGKTVNEYSHQGYLAANKFFWKGDDLWYYEVPPRGNGSFYRIDIQKSPFQRYLCKELDGTQEEKDSDLGIWSIYQDRNGMLWLGDLQGLKIMNPAENVVRPFNRHNQFSELGSATILDIQEDLEGTIWLSTNKGFYTLDIDKGITARYWSEGEGKYFIPTDNVQHFYQDRDGVYWLATGGQGLVRWDREKSEYAQFTTSNGLPNNVIYAVYEDDFQNLWLSSDYGIIQFDKQALASRSFLLKDGITHEEFNRISHYQAEDGTTYFGGLNGVTAFHPRDFQVLDTIPDVPLRVTEFVSTQYLNKNRIN